LNGTSGVSYIDITKLTALFDNTNHVDFAT